MFAVAHNGHSHGKVEIKNKCSWGWRYKTKARVNNGLGITSQTTFTCGSVCQSSASNVCAWQQANYVNGAISTPGSVFATPRLCGRGFTNSDLFYATYGEEPEPAFAPAPGAVPEECNVTTGDPVFKKPRITIPGINGMIAVNEHNVYSSLEITVWKPEHDSIAEDTIADPSEIIWQGKIELYNGSATASGRFPATGWSLVSTSTGHDLKFLNMSIEVILPAGMDGIADELIVDIQTDAGYRESFARLLAGTEEALKESAMEFSAFPNPSNGQFKITYNPGSVTGMTNVSIYDIQGRLVSEIFNGIPREGENIFEINLEQSAIRKGMYYILIKNEEDQFLKKIMIE